MTSPAPKPQGMVDKIAEEIWLAHPMGWETFGDTPLPWHIVENIWGDQYRRAARAAIEAMREPTAHMKISGANALRREAMTATSGRPLPSDGGRCFRAMIDAILAEKSI